MRAHGRERFQTFTGALDGVDSENEILRVEPNSTRFRAPHHPPQSVGRRRSRRSHGLPSIYPYACTEQTMSRFIPALLVNKGLDPSRKSEAERYVRQGIARLYELQHESGAWGWEHDADDAWMTAYVLYGLGIARSQGYAVNPEVLRRGPSAQKRPPKRYSRRIAPS